MCGIFGLVKNENSNISDSDTLEVINKLLSFHKLEEVSCGVPLIQEDP